LGGVDSLYSIVQMPAGIPVATVSIGNGRNAGLLAMRMLSINNAEIAHKLEAFSEDMKELVEKMNDEVSRTYIP
jgi:phosphoribosylaminoimidazole carboxylase PurE protein